jgi:hypothetical protein
MKWIKMGKLWISNKWRIEERPQGTAELDYRGSFACGSVDEAKSLAKEIDDVYESHLQKWG